MKIREVEPIITGAPEGEPSSPWSSTMVLVRVTTANGAVGWGEAPTTLMTLPVRESVREVARFYVGRELESHASAFATFCRYSFYHSRSIEATAALSAVDIACHDLQGREAGVPISELLGPALRDRVRAYANGWYSDCIEPEEFAAKARDIVRQGMTALKFDPFGDQYGDLSTSGLAAASARVRAVREAVGAAVDLLIEFHGRFYPEAALRAGRELERYTPRFVEEPVHPELSDALVEFRRSIKTPVALGERLLTPADFRSFLDRGLVDILQPDITNSGGFSSGREISAIAASVRAPVAYHNAFGPIQTAATLQMDAVLPTFFVQESFEASWPAWKRALVSGYELADGQFRIPRGPGLGVRVDEGALDRIRTDTMEPVGPEPPWVIAGTWSRRGTGTYPSGGSVGRPVERR